MAGETETMTKDAKESISPLCSINMDAVLKLKDSAKKILTMIDEMQLKTVPKNSLEGAFANNNAEEITQHADIVSNIPDRLPGSGSFQKIEDASLEDQIQVSDGTEMEDNDCSIYKKLMRKCYCLNQPDYNDIVMLFNEDTKYSTSQLGEITKNICILKQMLYIGCSYTRRALMFLNEGLWKLPLNERVDILIACSQADICNVFKEESLVNFCIEKPLRNKADGDQIIQNLAARLLYNMARVEEGRRYLNFNSKTLTNLQLLLKTKSGLDDDTKDFIRDTITILSPSKLRRKNATYFPDEVKSLYGQDGEKSGKESVPERTPEARKHVEVESQTLIKRPKVTISYTQ